MIMMEAKRVRRIAAVAMLLISATPALAQGVVPGNAAQQRQENAAIMDQIRRLDREAEQGARQRRPVVPAHPVTRAAGDQTAPVLPAQTPLTCLGTDEGLQVLAAPDAAAPQIGLSFGYVAAGSVREHGYREVVHYNGRHGWVRDDALHAYASTVRPGASCSVTGLRPNGSPVFHIG